MYRRRIAASLLASIAVCLICPPAPAADADPAAIVNLAEQSGIASVGDLFTVQGTFLVCVRDRDRKQSLLDPSHPTSRRDDAQGCPSPATSINALVDFPLVPGMIPVPRQSGFAGAKSITLGSVGITQCGPILPNYYTVTYPDGSTSSFYIIVRLSKPFQLTLPDSCGEELGQPLSVSLDFDEVATLVSVDLGNRSTLLSGWHGDAVEPALLSVRTLPRNVWTSDHNVFVVPREILGPLLDKAGNNPGRRYHALLEIVGHFSAPM